MVKVTVFPTKVGALPLLQYEGLYFSKNKYHLLFWRANEQKYAQFSTPKERWEIMDPYET